MTGGAHELDGRVTEADEDGTHGNSGDNCATGFPQNEYCISYRICI